MTTHLSPALDSSLDQPQPKDQPHPRGLLRTRLGPVFWLLRVFLVANFGLRLALALRSWSELDGHRQQLLPALLIGSTFDLLTASWALLPAVLYLALVPRALHATRLHAALVRALLCIACALLLFGLVSEWVYWDEFSGRFDFIAVDYLVYTQEVMGNIRESYPMGLILSGIALVTLGLMFALRRSLRLATAPDRTRARPRLALALLLALPALDFGLVRSSLADFPENRYLGEVAKNGLYSLFSAFRNNELDFERYYRTIDEEQAYARMRARIASPTTEFSASSGTNLQHLVRNEGERRANVVILTVESLSASYLGCYGSDKGLTPALDALAPECLRFTSFFATGTRTVRGLESLTLSVPPTPGRSILKRPVFENLDSIGWVFQERGYQTKFLYGGYGYFDNMNAYFAGNGFEVVDRRDLDPDEIQFSNVWGVCDQDLLARELAECDAAYAARAPFFHLVMTTSNHRPFTYPDVIDIPSGSSRKGAVKYTDLALGQFMAAARTRPWYDETLFVIVADHCAKSAGREEIDLARYRIPLLVHASWLEPREVDALGCQIDLAPTLLGLLGFDYRSSWYGRDLLQAPPQRALLGNYQSLGLFDGRQLAVLRPDKSARFYAANETWRLTVGQPDAELELDLISYYQTASTSYEAGGLARLASTLADVPEARASDAAAALGALGSGGAQ